MRQYSHALAITPNDTTPLAQQGVYGFIAAAAGTVTFSTYWDYFNNPTSPASTQITVLAGVIYPIRVSLIKATGTTATGIVVLW